MATTTNKVETIENKDMDAIEVAKIAKKVKNTMKNPSLKTIKDHLSVKEVMQITDDVLYIVINNDDGVYRPELFEYYFRMYVVEAFTGKEYDDLDKSYDELFGINNIFSQIVERTEETGEISALRSALVRKISYYVSKDLKKSKFDDLFESISNLLNSSTGLVTEETQNVMKKFSSMENLNLQSVISTVMEYVNKPAIGATNNVVNLPNKEV